MADPKHVAKLEEGVDAWNRWREENPEIRPNLDQAKLPGFQLNSAALHETSLRGALLIGANLDSADIYGSDLERANLYGANLTNANLTGATLPGANLSSAVLTGSFCGYSNLRGAHLSEADFSYSDLNHSDLQKAELVSTNLNYSNLQNVNFRSAIIGMTSFGHLDLSKNLHLDLAEHSQASIVGNDTLSITAAALSKDSSNRGPVETFLRAAGLSEPFMALFASLIENPIEFYTCFISYAHADKAFARRLYDSLQGRGIRCWLDEKDLRPGDPIFDHVNEAIRLHDKVLLCCSLGSLTSKWVDTEIASALQAEMKTGSNRLIPLDLDGYLLDGWDGPKAELVRSRLAADFTGWKTDHDKFEAQLERVVEALRTDRAVSPCLASAVGVV